MDQRNDHYTNCQIKLGNHQGWRPLPGDVSEGAFGELKEHTMTNTEYELEELTENDL